MKKKLLIYLMIFSVLICLCVDGKRVHAQENKEMDIVMVLDQSGSMNDNDSDKMMLEATKTLIGMMPSQTGRAGIITFNMDHTVVAPLTQLNDRDAVDALYDQVGQIKYKGATNIGDAVAEAVNMFDLNDGRIHAVLVLSDGQNEFKNYQKSKEVESDENLADALKIAKNNGIQIFCLGFGEEMSDKDGVGYKKLTTIATDENHLSTETDPGQIQTFFLNMLSSLTGGNVLEITDNVVHIAKNVKEANIYIKTTDSSAIKDVDITLTGPDGNAIELTNGDNLTFYKYDYSAVIKLFNPAAGDYTLGTTSDKIEISTIYIPIYDYVLNSRTLDSEGQEITTVQNSDPVTIETVISQDGQEITDPDVYGDVTATATVTAKDTGEVKDPVSLTYYDGKLYGTTQFDHEATYEIRIDVVSQSFTLSDVLEISSSKQDAKIGTDDKGQVRSLDDVRIDKTLKKSVTRTLPSSELLSIVEDPDGVGVQVIGVESSNEDNVTAVLEDNGDLTLTALSWGSSLITVSYKDGLGNTFNTTFTAKVSDKVLMAFYAALPVIFFLIILLIIFLIMRKSRVIRGTLKINYVLMRRPGSDMPTHIDIDRSYLAKAFFRKGNMAYGMATCITDACARDALDPDKKELYRLLKNDSKETEIYSKLSKVKVTGTYLGLKGAIFKIDRGTDVSLNNNMSYGMPVKLSWTRNVHFRLFTRDYAGYEISIDGEYMNDVRKASKSSKKKGKKGTRNMSNRASVSQQANDPFGGYDSDFDDDFHF